MSSGKYEMSGQGTLKPHGLVVPSGTTPSPDPVPLEIERLAAGGRGVGRQDGLVWLVSGALPGERVLAKETRRSARHVEGVATEILERSRSRREPACPFQAECGGCPWMSLEEEGQRDWKRRLVEDALTRIGRTKEVAVDPVRPSPRQLAYRNKVEFSFGSDSEGRMALGLYRAESRDLVDVDRCLLQDETANAILGSAREFFLEGPGRSEPALRTAREPLRLVIRRSSEGSDALVALRGLPVPFPSAADFAGFLTARHPQIVGVVRLLVDEGRRGGSTIRVLHGRAWIEEKMAGTVFRVPAAAFFQVNSEAAEVLAEVVVELAAPLAGARVLELYGGVGALSFALVRSGAHAPVVVEADREAVACGREAVSPGVEESPVFVRSDVLRYLRSPEARSKRVDVVVADPPRTGLGRGVAEGIASLRPERLVLVSCDPATLGRDTRELGRIGYTLRRVIPIDLFPQTAAIESIALFEKGVKS